MNRPDWFSDAIDAPYQRETLDVDACPIHTLSWGDRGKPGLVFVHGGLAHAHWWRYLAPFFSGQCRVIALDLSGHGDSGLRDLYSRNIWVQEVRAVIDRADFAKPPILIGHSMGGLVSFAAASALGQDLAGVVIVDAPISGPVRREPDRGGGRTFKFMKTYPDLETAKTRFRLMPDQPCENAFLLDFLAEHSLKQTADGWRWKFDPLIFEKIQVTPLETLFAGVRCPWAFIRGEFSEVVAPEIEDYLIAQFGEARPFIVIPRARHHLVLDQPLAFVSALRAILELWGHR